MTNAALD